MSLFSSIRMAGNTLQANEIALQVVGQNIANANTPGYIREEVVLSPAPTQRLGRLLLGLGVEVEAIVQKIDHFLEERLRGSVSERMDAETRESSYLQLEGVIGELSDTDLSTSLVSFFSKIEDVLNFEGENADMARNLAVLQGVTLTNDINNIADRVTEIHSDLNDRVIDMAGTINRLIEEIRVLNVKIANTEGGEVSASDAVGLRDQRLMAMQNLAELIDVKIREQPSGGVVIYRGGEYLVFEGASREVEVVMDPGTTTTGTTTAGTATSSSSGLPTADIHLIDTHAPLNPSSGELAGLLYARDQIMGDYLDKLDSFSRTLAFEFNKLYSSGQGLNGYQSLTSEFAVSSSDPAVDGVDVALNAAGLEYTPVNGSFQVLVRNKDTGETVTTDIFVDLDGLGQDMTLAELATDLNAISGITAATTTGGKLTITSDSSDQEFAFKDDSSGLLAALGLNTFFSGSSARDLGVNEVVRNDPATFAASLGGIGADTDNAERLAAFLDYPIESQNGVSLSVLYDRMIASAAQEASIARAEAEGARVFEQTLRGQKMATSGVSLDEEAVKMIAYQRSFQASARYIGTLDELLGLLVNL